MKNFKKNAIYTLILVIGILLIGCSKKAEESKDTPDNKTEVVENKEQTTDESYEEESNYNSENKNSKIISKDKDYDYGSVILAEYKGLKHNIVKSECTELDIRAMIEGLSYSAATTKYVTSGVASRGDTVNISFVATDENGNEVDRSSDKGLKLTLGDHSYYEGLDDGIYGLEVGQSNSFPIDYKDYLVVENRNIKDKIINFDVTLNGIYIRNESNDLQFGTDEFVNTFLYSTTNCRTVKELEEYVKNQVEEYNLEQYTDSLTTDLLTQLFKTCEVSSYSEELAEEYYNNFWEKCINNARDESITIDKYLELTQQSYFQLDNKFKEKAENCAKADAILISIARKENLNSTQDALQFLIDNSIYDESAYTSNLKDFYDYDYITFGY